MPLTNSILQLTGLPTFGNPPTPIDPDFATVVKYLIAVLSVTKQVIRTPRFWVEHKEQQSYAAESTKSYIPRSTALTTTTSLVAL